MSGSSPEQWSAVLAWLGGACFCGVLPLCLAALLAYLARKRSRTGSAVGAARKSTTAALQPGDGLVRLQGRIAPRADALDGPAENALVYLRLKVEKYEDAEEYGSGWRGLTDKARGIPFQLDDGYGTVWVNPDGLDKELLGKGIKPTREQIEVACRLLGINPKILRGELRFTLWELRAGQSVTVVGTPIQTESGLVIAKAQGQPFLVSPLLGEAVDEKIAKQAKTSTRWALVLGISGLLFLLCGLGGALAALVRMLAAK